MVGSASAGRRPSQVWGIVPDKMARPLAVPIPASSNVRPGRTRRGPDPPAGIQVPRVRRHAPVQWGFDPTPVDAVRLTRTASPAGHLRGGSNPGPSRRGALGTEVRIANEDPEAANSRPDHRGSWFGVDDGDRPATTIPRPRPHRVGAKRRTIRIGDKRVIPAHPPRGVQWSVNRSVRCPRLVMPPPDLVEHRVGPISPRLHRRLGGSRRADLSASSRVDRTGRRRSGRPHGDAEVGPPHHPLAGIAEAECRPSEAPPLITCAPDGTWWPQPVQLIIQRRQDLALR